MQIPSPSLVDRLVGSLVFLARAMEKGRPQKPTEADNGCQRELWGSRKYGPRTSARGPYFRCPGNAYLGPQQAQRKAPKVPFLAPRKPTSGPKEALGIQARSPQEPTGAATEGHGEAENTDHQQAFVVRISGALETVFGPATGRTTWPRDGGAARGAKKFWGAAAPPRIS